MKKLQELLEDNEHFESLENIIDISGHENFI